MRAGNLDRVIEIQNRTTGLDLYGTPIDVWTTFATMRSYGPLPAARFDPHPEPAAESRTELVLYASETLLTALAERFQHNREIRRTPVSLQLKPEQTDRWHRPGQ